MPGMPGVVVGFCEIVGTLLYSNNALIKKNPDIGRETGYQ
jgi:hypothetical protein